MLKKKKNYSVTIVEVLNNQGSASIKKPVGKYITIDVPNLDKTDEDLKDEISIALSKELKSITEGYKKKIKY